MAENKLMIPTKDELEGMMNYCDHLAKSGLFPVKNGAEMFGMVQIALSEGIPPIKIFEKYHLVPRGAGVVPTLKSIWIMGEFCRQGGKLNWVDTGEPMAVHLVAIAASGSRIEVKKTLKEVQQSGAQLGPAWKLNPEQMLRYRAAVTAIKAIAPQILSGNQADVDVEDVPKVVQVEISRQKAIEAPRSDPAPSPAPEPTEEPIASPELPVGVEESRPSGPPADFERKLTDNQARSALAKKIKEMRLSASEAKARLEALAQRELPTFQEISGDWAEWAVGQEF